VANGKRSNGNELGTIDNLAGRVPLDDFLRPRQWKPG
jgi:hypothetical protein